MATPADFAPFAGELSGCECPECLSLAAAASDVRDHAGRRQLAAARALLTSLRAGTHVRRTLAEHAADARAAKAARLAEMRAAGAPEADIAAVERGYGRAGSMMRSGLGVGMTVTR